MCERSAMAIIGHVWKRTGDRWERQLLRRCIECEGYVIEDMTWMVPEYPYCFTCLSHDLRLDPITLAPRCNACGAAVVCLDDAETAEV